MSLKILKITFEQTPCDGIRCYYQTSNEVYEMHVERDLS